MPSTLKRPAVELSFIASLPRVSATMLKNHFGEASGRANGGAVAITRHRRPEFVLVPVREYVELQKARNAPLVTLTGSFDKMVARMNTPAAKRGTAKLFQATPKDLGKAAVKAAAHAP